jgi:WD40 repeat protein/nucleoside phosphorylase
MKYHYENTHKGVLMIGIITALPKEYAAVEVLLEQPHLYAVAGAGAGRQYLLGEIPAANGGSHQVVLALLSSMGTGLAATQASRLLEHFPQIRTILMVGIAGGVPSPSVPDDHVRLGDIVVSDQYGVIQYDFVKRTTGQTLYRPFPRPPGADLLLTARLLEAGQLKGLRPWQLFIAQAQRRLRIARPAKETDLLASSDDPTQYITHPRDRKRHAGQPRVFIGQIASANTLLKDARLRDELRDRFHVKAVEMEAAGIADATWDLGASYLVIRGICDYCDANKSDSWQEYATIAAAGYMRALLQSLPATSARLDTPIRQSYLLFTSAGYEPPQSPTGTIHRPPPLVDDLPPGYVHRQREFQALKDSLLRTSPDRLTAMTSALKAAGGYGKTTLAQALCRDTEIRQAFPDGIEWVTLGNALTMGDLVDKVKDLIYRLSGTRPPVTNLEVARAELQALLAERRLLLVLDDAWFERDLKPFLHGGPSCARLITTRNEDALPDDVEHIPIDAMQDEEAIQVLCSGIGALEEFKAYEQALYDLIDRRLRRWPLLLALANGMLRHHVKRHHHSVADALAALTYALDKRGLLAFDPQHPQERQAAAALTLDASLDLLNPDDATRYLQLAIFPENTFLPLAVVHRLWESTTTFSEQETDELCMRLYDLSLLRFYDSRAQHLQLHDVIRDYLRFKEVTTLPTLQRQFLATYHVNRWADLPTNESYLWKYLVTHLIETQQQDVLLSTMVDLRYLATKVYVQQSAYAAEADLEQAATAVLAMPILHTLKQYIAKSSDLFYRSRTLQEMECALLSQLYAVEELTEACQALQQEIPRPFLMPWYPFPEASKTALIRTLRGHTAAVTACAISPDGNWIVSASADKTLKLWNAHSGALRFTLEGHSAAVTSCVINPDGNRILSTSEDGTIRVWNAYTGNELLVLRGHKGAVTDCAISPDGNWIVSAATDKTLKCWDIHTLNEPRPLHEYKGVHLKTLRGHSRLVTSCAIGPDGTWIISASEDQTVRRWDAHSGAQIQRYTSAEDEIVYDDCAISRDGSWIISTTKLGLQVWDVQSGEERLTTYGHVGYVLGCAVSPDGTWMLSASMDGTLKGWRTDTGVDVFIFKGHTDEVKSCAISPGGDWVVSASDDHTLKVWQVPAQREERLPDEEEYTFSWLACAISPDGEWGVALSYIELTRWNLRTGAQETVLSTVAGYSARCVISPDGAWIVAASNDEHTPALKLWDADTSQELLTMEGHTASITSCAISPDGTWIVSASADHTLKLWDVRTGGEVRTLAGHSDALTSCAISPDGTWIVSASADRTLIIWDTDTGTVRHTLQGHTAPVLHCTITPDGETIISTASDGTIRLWSIDAPTHPPTVLQPGSMIQKCLASPGGQLIVALANDHIQLWDRHSGEHLTTFTIQSNLSDCALHPDGEHLIVAAEHGLYLLRLVE